MSISPRSGAHFGERNLFLSRIRRSNRIKWQSPVFRVTERYLCNSLRRDSGFCLRSVSFVAFRATYAHSDPPTKERAVLAGTPPVTPNYTSAVLSELAQSKVKPQHGKQERKKRNRDMQHPHVHAHTPRAQHHAPNQAALGAGGARGRLSDTPARGLELWLLVPATTTKRASRPTKRSVREAVVAKT